MKIICLLVSFFLFSLLLQGQTEKHIQWNKKRNKSANCKEKFLSPFTSINDSIIITPKKLSDTLSQKKSFEDKNDSIFRNPDNSLFRNPGPCGPETYPGAPRFYRKSPQMQTPYEKSFLIPYVASKDQKYFLIIKDPITHRIIN